MKRLPHNRILVGDVRSVLPRLPSDSVDCIITSPPYFRLRNYQHDRQIGLEAAIDQWVDELRIVARGLGRVLKPGGVFWLNLADTYSRRDSEGATPKSLLLGPERVALALVADGWILRNKVIWTKPNPMPTSVRDRLSCTWEAMYCFTRSRHYFFDLDTIRVPHRGTRTSSHTPRTAWSVPDAWRGPSTGTNSGLDRLKAAGRVGHPLGKNPGDVWTIPTAGYRGAHHAVFPEQLAERPLLATCPERVCAQCGAPWQRQLHEHTESNARPGSIEAGCECPPTSWRPGVVLDPFMGSGTTAVVAERHRRDWIGIELNPEIAALAEAHIGDARERRQRDEHDPANEARAA